MKKIIKKSFLALLPLLSAYQLISAEPARAGSAVSSPQGSGKIQVKSYRYLSATPNSGDDSGTTLTDGVIGEKSQIHYDWYSEDPYIEFDLGAVYLIDRIELQGIAVPSQNIAGITVETSSDGKQFRAAANFANKDVSAEKKLFAITGENQKLPGRYFRIRGSRSRTDFPIDISEVTFYGKQPTAEELRIVALANSKSGPEMPEISNKDYYLYKSASGSFAICKKTGILRQLTVDGTVLVDRMLGRYDLSDGKNQLLSNDYSAKVTGCKTLDNGVEVSFTVNQLDNITFKRFYGWVDGVFTTRLAFDSERTDRQILQTGCEVVLLPDIRSGGRYETWGAGHSFAYKYADDLITEMSADTGPVVSFESPNQGLTFLAFRYRYADRYVQIGSGTVTVVGYGDKRTKFTPAGWVLGDGLFEVNSQSRSGSIESRLIVVKGDLIQAFDQYIALPETEKFRSKIQRPTWLKDVRMHAYGDSWKNLFGDNAVRNAAFYDKFIREGCILNLQRNNTFVWGDWDKSLQRNSFRNEFGGEMSAAEHADFIRRLRAGAPKTKVTEYTWMWSAHTHSEVFRQHPEWFISKNASGATVSFFQGALNHYRLYGRPGSPSFEHAVQTITNTIEQYQLDFWYLDGGGSPSAIDWARLIIEEPDTYDLFYQTVRNKIRSHSDRGIFFNHPENPLADFGYLEGSASAFFSEANWREGAGWMYKFKLWQRPDKLFIPCFTYWSGPAIENLKYYVIGTGLFPMISPDNAMSYIKYLSIHQQTRWGRLVSADFEPNWRNDPECLWELMPLTFGKQGHLMVRSRFDRTESGNFSCDMAPLGITNEKLPVYYYQYSVVPSPGAIPESEAEAAYRATGFQSDFLLKGKFLGTRQWSKRLQQQLTLAARSMELIYVTQSPALIWSVDDLRLQYPMSEALDVSVEGKVYAKLIALTTQNNRRTAEIIANLPAQYSARTVTVNNQKVQFVPMSVMDGNFVRFTIPQGKADIKIELAEAQTLPHGNYVLSAAPAKPGEKMIFNLHTPVINGKATGNLTIFNAHAIPVWNGALDFSGNSTQALVQLPDVLTGGKYHARAFAPDSKLLAEYQFTLANAPAKLKPVVHKMSPLVGDVQAIKPVNSSAGTVITDCAQQYSQGDCNIILDPENATVTLQMAKRPQEIWSLAAGAMRNSNLKRYIKVRIEGNYADFICRSTGLRNVTPCYGDSPSCAVITLDFEAPDGFTVRSFAGLGIVFANRPVALPDNYGTKRIPDHISAVSGFCMGTSGNSEEHWFDLQQLGAPANWNGNAYLGLCLQNSTPDRTLKLTLLATCDTLPPDAKLSKAAVMKGSARQAAQQLKIPVISTPAVIDGKLDETLWSNALLLTDFNMLGAPAVAAPPSKLKLLTDGKMLYIGAEFVEPGEINADPNAGNAWETDGLEIYLGRGKDNKSFDQYIFSSGGLCHAARNFPGNSKQMLPAPAWKCTIQDKTIYIEAAVPLKYAPNDPAYNGFNAGRNRTGGKNGFYALANDNTFRSFDQFKLVWE